MKIFELRDCEDALLEHIAFVLATRDDIVLTYARAFASPERTIINWQRIHRAIERRWSAYAATYIRRSAIRLLVEGGLFMKRRPKKPPTDLAEPLDLPSGEGWITRPTEAGTLATSPAV